MDTSRTAGRDAILVALLLMAASGAIPRVWGLDRWMLSSDDALHLDWAAQPTAMSVVRVTLQHDTHPPGFYLVLHAMIALGAAGTQFLPRLVSLIPGVALVFPFFRLGVAASGGRIGGLTLALVAAYSNSIVLQSQTVRQYAIMLFFVSWMLSAFLDRRRSPTPYFVLAAISLTTLYINAVVIAVLGTVGAITLWRDTPGAVRARVHALAPWVLGHLALGLCWVGMLAQCEVAKPSRDNYFGYGMIRSTGAALDALLQIFSRSHLASSGPLSWVLIVPIGWGLFTMLRTRRGELIAITIAPVVIAIVLSAAGIYPVGASRWMLWLVPTSILPLACAFQDVRRRLGLRGCVVAATAIGAAVLWNQAAGRSGSLFSPDGLRANDEGSVHWMTEAEHEEAIALIDTHVANDDTVTVDLLEAQLQKLATRFAWPSYQIDRMLVTCPVVGMLDTSEARRCIARASPVTRYAWLLVRLRQPWTSPARTEKLLADPCVAVTQSYPGRRFLLVNVDLARARACGA